MSNCNYCRAEVIWIQKPNGGWFPPFNAADELVSMDYVVTWDVKSQNWVASPTDIDIEVKMTRHLCEERDEYVRRNLFKPEVDVEESTPVPTRRELPERVVYRNPKPEQYERIALRLRSKCPTCGAMPFIWCTYKDYPDEQTVNLHTSRS